jgi:SAM-dependent methyltransferase
MGTSLFNVHFILGGLALSVGLTACGSGAPAVVQPTSAPMVHDPANPPIDCPMHKAGINHADMKPFAETEKYIAFLERADRAVWQKPDAVVAALGLKGSERVVDVGAGSGYFAFRFAEALPAGTVVAADIEPEMVRHMHHKAMTTGVKNLEAKVITPADPAVPGDADLVFVCDVLHHVTDRPAWLGKITGAMKPGARLALVEFAEGDLPKGPPAAMKIPRAELVALMAGAGLTLKAEHSELLPYQVFLVFEKP